MHESTEASGFTELSHRYAKGGDLRLAALAAWAADVHALEALLWDSGLDQAPDPSAELAAVGESMADSIEALAARPGDRMTLRAVVEIAREAMVATFDESVHGLLTDRLADLGHLDEARAGEPFEQLGDRLGGRSTEELVAELHGAAADCSAMAALLAADGEHEAAVRLSDQADSASFEAYLVQAAARAGDDALATVDLRWDLASRSTGSGDGPMRERLVALLGSAEQEVLRRLLKPVER